MILLVRQNRHSLYTYHGVDCDLLLLLLLLLTMFEPEWNLRPTSRMPSKTAYFIPGTS